eukprot:TRINITY_DN13774_c0_g1_i5.p1 TRINITY_DN13774_c0_g1~~TRINITY_DN13774_c0_g1_i5.p1  ORF type:complete len:365 (-),score=62.76 TRINITY_DN13774_c0_g1_i5:167-1261(-)
MIERSGTLGEPEKAEEVNPYEVQSTAKDLKIREMPGVKNEKKLILHSKFVWGESEVFTARIDPEDNLIATGCSDGLIKIFDINLSKSLRSVFACIGEPIPITGLRWRPSTQINNTKNILVSCSADGNISYWHATTGKLIHRITEAGNQVLGIDFRSDGELLASGGKDYKVRVYDDDTKSLSVVFNGAEWQYTGHSNRVFAVKFLNDNPNMLISGGWDNTIQIWDIREGKSVGSIYGASISGDSLDYSKGTILTGSYRNKDQLQLWDLGERKLIETLDWGSNFDSAFIYGAQFSKNDGQYIIAGCVGNNQVRVFDRTQRNKAAFSIEGSSKGIYTVDFANNSSNFVFGGGEGIVYYMNLSNSGLF